MFSKIDKHCFLWIACMMISGVGVSQSITNVGTDFWIAFPPNWNSSGILYLYISSNYATTGTVFSEFPGVNQEFSVTPGNVTQLILPSGVELAGGVENKGIRVTSLQPISLYGLNRYLSTTDAFLALPIIALGTDYRIMSYTVSVSVSGSCLSAVATQDGTVITVFNHQTGSTEIVSLNMGQTYHLESPSIGDDLTGSRVQSNYPVAVFGSVEYVNITGMCIGADHVVEQMFPYYSWGKNYVTVPLAGRDASGDIFRILAAEDGTEVSINGIPVTILSTGDHYEANLTGNNSITTSHAALLAQFAKGISCSGNITGDPFMMLIPPREQFLTNYTIGTVAGFNTHWVNVVAPDYALGTIYQDGELIPNGEFTQISTTNFYGAQRPVTEGSHTFSSIFPFGVFSYGWTLTDSYGYAGGASFSRVGTVDSISISPDTLYGELNVTNICLTANVLDNMNNPVEGILVNFNITGINPITGNAYTNSAGNAQYCYTQTGFTPGIDHVYAETFGYVSDTAIVFWSYLPPCINPVNGGTIGVDQSGCGTYLPFPLTGILFPTGQTGTLEYKWQMSVIGSTSGFTDVPSSNSPSISPDSVSQTTWYRRLARVSCMGDWSGAAESNVIELTVILPPPVGVTIEFTGNGFCAGNTVTFTATPVNGGLFPAYQWKVNGNAAGSNNPQYSYTPVNGDVVTCMLTSSETCTSGNPDTSNTLSVTVNPLLPAGISISASSNALCPGNPVTFTATPENGGANPVYQWKVNGANAGTNSPTFTYSPVNSDSVLCMMTSGIACVTGSPASSNRIDLIVLPVPAVIFVPCFDTITHVMAKPFRLKGGIPLGGVYSGPGVAIETGIFNPSMAGAGTKTIAYTYTNAALCAASAMCHVQVASAVPLSCGYDLTDIRDGKVYPTVLIGTQCWFASNLKYGHQVSGNQHQRDNCIPEKYMQPPPGLPLPGEGIVYQWDEMMQYAETPGWQGLCPPGWHVPTEADWNTLFANWTNSAFSGAPLLYSGYSGFDAYPNGINHLNRQWDFEDFATFFWSSTPHGSNKAWSHGMNVYNTSVSTYPALRANAFSVRCVCD